MTIKESKDEIVHWKFTKARFINFGIGLGALLIYEFFARPFYRPYVYSRQLNDFHIADTLGNSLGTVATIFIFLAIIGKTKAQHNFLIVTITMSLIVFEVVHPLLGKPIDKWDAMATLVTGGFVWLLYRLIHGSELNIKA